MNTKSTFTAKDGERCVVVGGTHAGKSGIVRDIKTSKTGAVTITVVQANGERFKTLAKNVAAPATAKPKPKARKTKRESEFDVGPRTAALMAILDAKPGAVANPMGAPRASTPSVLIYKVMGKMFAILSVRKIENVILKCDPNLAQALREEYAGVGHRSHLDRRFWISVTLDADVPADEVARLAGHSYELVCSSLTRKQKAELAALSA